MRYLLFAGKSYYARGGWQDFVGRYETIEAAEQAARDLQAANENERRRIDEDDDNYDDPPIEIEWWHVIDIETGNYVAQHSSAYGAVDVVIS